MRSIAALARFIGRILMRQLVFPTTYVGQDVEMPDGLRFTVFRHMKRRDGGEAPPGAILVIRFRFARGSNEANIRASRIPIPLIGGSLGFRDKVWMIDRESGFWQGVYCWEDERRIADYRASFVLGLMNRRAAPESLAYTVIPGMDIDRYLGQLARHVRRHQARQDLVARD